MSLWSQRTLVLVFVTLYLKSYSAQKATGKTGCTITSAWISPGTGVAFNVNTCDKDGQG